MRFMKIINKGCWRIAKRITRNSFGLYALIAVCGCMAAEPDGTSRLLLLDTNVDGFVDVLSLVADQPVRHFVNDGGQLGRPLVLDFVVTDPFDAEAADFDRDGDPDVVLAGVAGLTLLRNDGHGSFTQQPISATTATDEVTAVELAVADFDGDGWPDLYLHNTVWRAGELIGDNWILNNSAVAAIEFSQAEAREQCCVRSAVTLDIDNDRDDDVVFLQGATLAHWLTDNQQSLVEHRQIAHGVDNFVVLDWNADGMPDLLTVGVDGSLQAYRNDRTGGLVAVGGSVGAVLPGDIEAIDSADFDNDGYLDIAVLHAGALKLFAGRGRLGFRRMPDLPATNSSARATRIATADLDRDGFADIVLLTQGNEIEVVSGKAGRNLWLGIELKGYKHATTQGAKVTVARKSGALISGWARRKSTVIGLGRLSQVDGVVIEWPQGYTSYMTPSGLNAYLLAQGVGSATADGGEAAVGKPMRFNQRGAFECR